MFKCNQLK